MIDSVQVIKLEPKYVRENVLQVLELDSIKIPDGIEIKDQSIVHMFPGAVGGNHKHPRIEIFIGFGDLAFYYMEDELKSIKFGNDIGFMKMIVVPSMLPHAVRNESDTEQAVLYELANAKQYDSVQVEVIKNILK
ncbi:MAG: hypothetical protein KDC67_14110, partial [Ignavibacteriae bacterium]|nr:hypothetical protein [Ignavibacteriota bacterium]